MDYRARLESVSAPQGHRGFESPPLRHFYNNMKRAFPQWMLVLLTGAVLVRMVFFTISVRNLPPTADECCPFIQAEYEVQRGQWPLLFIGQPYQFPIDSYMAALFTWLPRNAFGVRILFFGAGLITLALFLVILRELGPWQECWPGVLLVLFPSTFVLMLQCACSIPMHSAFTVLSLLAVWLAIRQRRAKRGRLVLAALTGLVCGLNVSVHILSLSMIAAVALFVCLNETPGRALRSTALFLPGLLLGMLPFILAKCLLPGAYVGVSAINSKQSMIQSIWPMIEHTLPSIMGLTANVYPDSRLHLFPLTVWPARVLGLLLLVVLAIMLAVRAIRLAARTADHQWLVLKPNDIFLGASLLSLALFIASKRARATEARYLLVFAWCFPFILSYLYARASGGIKKALAGLVVLICMVNGMVTLRVMTYWCDRAAIRAAWKTPDLQPALDALRARKIKACYASFWNCYRVIHQSGGAIKSAMPWNLRFHFWPTPFLEEVRAEPAVFVLYPGMRFDNHLFEKHLRAANLTCTRERAGDWFIYTNIRAVMPDSGKRLPVDRYDVHVPFNEKDAPYLSDGRPVWCWKSRRNQEPGMAIELRFKKPETVQRVSLFYNKYPYDQALSLDLGVQDEQKRWHTVITNRPAQLAPFLFENGHPFYGDEVQTYRFPAIEAKALRIVINQPNSRRNWAIGEIVIYGDL